MIALKWVVTFARPESSEKIIGTLCHFRLAKRVALEMFREHPTCQLRIRQRWDHGPSPAWAEVYRHRGVDDIRWGHDDDDRNAEQPSAQAECGR